MSACRRPQATGSSHPRDVRRRARGPRPLAAVAARLVPALVVAGRCLAGDPEPRPAIAFRDMAAAAGIAFRFDTGARGQHDLPEVMGGGVALIDVDGDGRLDIYLCNGGPI